jgi:hypothetical protein
MSSYLTRYVLQLGILLLVSSGISGQDKFPVRRLSTYPAQEGFATWFPM